MSGSESSWRPRMSAGTAGAAELHCKIVPLGVVAEPVTAFSHCKIIPVAVVLSPFSRPAAWSTPSPPGPASPAGGFAGAASAAGGVAWAPSAASAGVAASAGSGSRCKLHRLAHAAASAMRPAFCRRLSQAICPPLRRLVGRPPLLPLFRRAPAGTGWAVLCCDGLTSSAGMGWEELQMPDRRQGENL